MKFKTRPGKKRRTVYLPKERKGKKKTTKTNKNKKRKTMKSYQAQYSSLERQLARNPRNLAAAIRLIAKEQKLSREMKEFKEMRTAEIQRQMEELENKDRSRRRGANKNKWSEADLKKYAKLQEELKQLNPFSYASKRGMNLQFDENSNVKEVGAMIQKYYEYVDKGIIKPRQFIDNYDQANYMASIMTSLEIKEAIKQADLWKEKSLANQRKRQEETLKLFENFNF